MADTMFMGIPHRSYIRLKLAVTGGTALLAITAAKPSSAASQEISRLTYHGHIDRSGRSAISDHFLAHMGRKTTSFSDALLSHSSAAVADLPALQERLASADLRRM